MGFTELEQAGKRVFEKYPVIKRTLKRAYQLASVATSHDHSKSVGDIRRITPEDGYEYFYGYYDKSPWDADDRYVIVIRVRQAYRSVAPPESGMVCLIDTKNENAVIGIGETRAWNVQQGCMAQWLGPSFKTHIIYNDFREGKYCSVIYNVVLKKEEKIMPLPVYDVDRSGSFALSLDFSRLHRMRPGYGYANIPDHSEGKLCPEETCIWKMDLQDGNVTELFKYTDFAAFQPHETMNGAEHKVNHLMISPNGKRFMVLHRWFDQGRKHTRLVTVNVDKSDMYNLSDDVFVSHCYWKNDDEILSFLRKKESGDHYYLMKDRTQEYRLLWPRLATDGHCSYSPDSELIVTDSYPNRKRMAFVYLCKEGQMQPVRIGRIYSPFKYDNNCRCDLHPRWNRKGDQICIDSVHEGRRALYVLPVAKKDIPVLPGPVPVYQKGKYKIVYVITNCKNSGPMNQTLNIIKNLDRKLFEPIVVTLFQEDLGNSVVQRYLDVVPEFHCLKMSKLESIVSGKKKLAALLETIKPDLIQGLGMPPYTMSLGYKDAVHLVTLRNYCYQDYPDKYGKLLGNVLAHKDMALIRSQIKRGETFVACSESLTRIYKAKHNLTFGFIRNGVDVGKYEYADSDTKRMWKERLSLPLDKTILIYSGQFIDRKDQKFAIEGVLKSDHAKDIFMVLLGEGPNLSGLREQYGKDSRILFTGNVTNVNEYLQAGDLYLSASKSEGMPNGVLEAMATGLPVLLSDIPQHLEVLEIDDRYGASYKLGDMNDFVKVFNEMLTRNLPEMGFFASKAANEELSAGKMSKRYQELYQGLVEKK